MAVVDDPVSPLPKPKAPTSKPVAKPATKPKTPARTSSSAGVSAADFALVQRVAKQYGIDPYILVAIGMHETGWGKLGDGRKGNILGVGSYDSGSTYKYAGLENQLVGAAKILKRHGVKTIADIAAGKLAPSNGKVRYASDPNWSNAIVKQYNKVANTNYTGNVSTAASAGKGVVVPHAVPADVKAQVQADYGYIAGFLDDKEIGPLLLQAAKEGWDTATLEGALYKTKFWKTHSATTRQWDAQVKLDPATARAQIQQQVATLAAEARKTGLDFKPGRLAQIALNSLRFGWSGKQISNVLLAEGKYGGAGKPSQLSASIAQLKEQAAQYLVPLSDQNLQKWAKQIANGELDTTAFEGYLKEQAKSMFPGMGAAIDSGVTVEQYVSPYQQIAAQTLEIPPESVNFLDPKWGKALFQTDTKTGARTSMSLADWQTTLRTDASYGFDKTQQARTTAADLTTQLGEAFGVIG